MMTLIIFGLAIWILVHFIPSVAMPFKLSLINTLGETAYKAVFSLLIVTSLVLMVMGWRATTPEYLYTLSEIVRPISIVLMAVVFVLFSSGKSANRIKNWVKHPQLVGVLLWSVAHLLLNGDTRSVLLFTSMGVWAVLEIIFINKRDGQHLKETVSGWGQEIKVLIIGLILFAIVAKLHPYLAGVSVVPV